MYISNNYIIPSKMTSLCLDELLSFFESHFYYPEQNLALKFALRQMRDNDRIWGIIGIPEYDLVEKEVDGKKQLHVNAIYDRNTVVKHLIFNIVNIANTDVLVPVKFSWRERPSIRSILKKDQDWLDFKDVLGMQSFFMDRWMYMGDQDVAIVRELVNMLNTEAIRDLKDKTYTITETGASHLRIEVRANIPERRTVLETILYITERPLFRTHYEITKVKA